ncbi:hypothetical protein BT63DRAFT_454193 [Microthyrium microscopicum]|uniref:Uncharacterized protein n=1 Tax=Microthyrium microscopicum TaxID=703497 RepID=A0A6A6UDV9_9PEZI|nr:hypothetical protein BT63DRAFT_454193 [Microthyrium microscopicum]
MTDPDLNCHLPVSDIIVRRHYQTQPSTKTMKTTLLAILALLSLLVTTTTALTSAHNGMHCTKLVHNVWASRGHAWRRDPITTSYCCDKASSTGLVYSGEVRGCNFQEEQLDKSGRYKIMKDCCVEQGRDFANGTLERDMYNNYPAMDSLPENVAHVVAIKYQGI